MNDLSDLNVVAVEHYNEGWRCRGVWISEPRARAILAGTEPPPSEDEARLARSDDIRRLGEAAHAVSNRLSRAIERQAANGQDWEFWLHAREEVSRLDEALLALFPLSGIGTTGKRG